MARSRLFGLVGCGLLLVGLVVVSTTGTAETAPVCSADPPAGAVSATHLGRYSTAEVPGSTETRAEIVAFEAGRLYVLNVGGIDVVDITNPAAPVKVATLPLPGEPTSVTVNRGLVAASVPAPVKTDPGRVLFFRGDRQVGEVVVGALPDMVVFTPDGKLLAVANEGEPNSYGAAGSVDPEGSISVITTQPFRASGGNGNPQPVETIRFSAFNAGGDRHGELPGDVRIFGPGATVAQDLEPEYITIADDNRTAWVSLQENNALAQLDLRAKRVERILPLGYSAHNRVGFGLDASDQGGAANLNIAPWPVRGLYMPDGIANYTAGGQRYVLTANEGDQRDWPGISATAPTNEEARRARSVADLVAFPDANDNLKLGRLNVTPFAPGLTTNPAGKLTQLYSFGTRSFSIRSTDGSLVWDSGDAFECITAKVYPLNFNASHSNNTLKNRSDDKGPEPEGVVTGKVGGRQLAFVSLERIGGVMVYDVSNPAAPVFQRYLTTRVFPVPSSGPVGPDSGPEGMAFIPAADSPTGTPVLAVGNEVSGTVNLWGLG